MLKRTYTVLPLYYDNSKRVFMTEEYRILEEIEEHQALMKEARMVGEDIMAIVRSIDEVWFPTLGGARIVVPASASDGVYSACPGRDGTDCS